MSGFEPTLNMRRRQGFTLIEVLLALAILATAFTVLMGTVSHSGQQSEYSTKMTRASLLARGQMVELEYMLLEEEFSDTERTFSGNFRDEGYPNKRWEARVEPVEIPPDAEEQFMARVNEQLFGGMDADGGALGGNPAFSAMLPMLMGQLPEFVNQLGQRVRRVILTVFFEFRGQEHPIEVTHYVVDERGGEFEMFGMPDGFDADDFDLGDEDFDGADDLDLDEVGR